MVFVTKKTLLPGKSGTLKEFAKYGDDLVYVRYKYDDENQRKIKTVEIIVDDQPWEKNSLRIPFNKNVYINIGLNEIQLKKTIQYIGGKLDKNKKMWKISYGDAINLGLDNRIVEF